MRLVDVANRQGAQGNNARLVDIEVCGAVRLSIASARISTAARVATRARITRRSRVTARVTRGGARVTTSPGGGRTACPGITRAAPE